MEWFNRLNYGRAVPYDDLVYALEKEMPTWVATINALN